MQTLRNRNVNQGNANRMPLISLICANAESSRPEMCWKADTLA